jgi:hypothetical protein
VTLEKAMKRLLVAMTAGVLALGGLAVRAF